MGFTATPCVDGVKGAAPLLNIIKGKVKAEDPLITNEGYISYFNRYVYAFTSKNDKHLYVYTELLYQNNPDHLISKLLTGFLLAAFCSSPESVFPRTIPALVPLKNLPSIRKVVLPLNSRCRAKYAEKAFQLAKPQLPPEELAAHIKSLTQAGGTKQPEGQLVYYTFDFYLNQMSF